jgi:predicted SnoaL-like aldol condensation-catalyzing enzyme
VKGLVVLLALLPWSFAGVAHAGPAENKALVKSFYEMVFVDHKAKEGAEKYLSPDYKQHNPNVPTGRQPFIDFFVPYFASNPGAKAEIKRLIAEDDLVVVHVHSRASSQDRGRAVVDIFRVKDGKIVEHWDVMQAVPEKAANDNSMF